MTTTSRADRVQHTRHAGADRIGTQLRRDNARPRERLVKLAALTDHYYCAYREAQSLLDLRERKLADLRQRLDLKPPPLRR